MKKLRSKLHEYATQELQTGPSQPLSKPCSASEPQAADMSDTSKPSMQAKSIVPAQSNGPATPLQANPTAIQHLHGPHGKPTSAGSDGSSRGAFWSKAHRGGWRYGDREFSARQVTRKPRICTGPTKPLVAAQVERLWEGFMHALDAEWPFLARALPHQGTATNTPCSPTPEPTQAQQQAAAAGASNSARPSDGAQHAAPLEHHWQTAAAALVPPNVNHSEAQQSLHQTFAAVLQSIQETNMQNHSPTVTAAKARSLQSTHSTHSAKSPRVAIPASMQDAAGDPAAKVSHRAELERVVKELHRMCVAHPEALDVVTSRVCKLKYGRLQQIQVTLDALRDYALSDFIRLAVYCTSDLLAPCPIGKSVEAWQGSSRINLAYVTARQQLTAASAKDANSDRLAEEDRAGGEHAEQQQSPGGAQKLVAVDTPDQMLKYANLLRKGYTRPSRASILQRLHNAANRGGSKFRRLTIKHGLVHDASSPGGGRESEDGEAFVEELAAVKHTEAQDAPDTVEPSKLSYSGVPILPRPKLSIAEQIAAARHKIKAMPAAVQQSASASIAAEGQGAEQSGGVRTAEHTDAQHGQSSRKRRQRGKARHNRRSSEGASLRSGSLTLQTDNLDTCNSLDSQTSAAAACEAAAAVAGTQTGPSQGLQRVDTNMPQLVPRGSLPGQLITPPNERPPQPHLHFAVAGKRTQDVVVTADDDPKLPFASPFEANTTKPVAQPKAELYHVLDHVVLASHMGPYSANNYRQEKLKRAVEAAKQRAADHAQRVAAHEAGPQRRSPGTPLYQAASATGRKAHKSLLASSRQDSAQAVASRQPFGAARTLAPAQSGSDDLRPQSGSGSGGADSGSFRGSRISRRSSQLSDAGLAAEAPMARTISSAAAAAVDAVGPLSNNNNDSSGATAADPTAADTTSSGQPAGPPPPSTHMPRSSSRAERRQLLSSLSRQVVRGDSRRNVNFEAD